MALLSTDAGWRREVVHRQDTQGCQHNDSGKRLFVTVVFGVVGGKSALGILAGLEVPKGPAMTTQVLRYRRDRVAGAVSPPSSSTEWGVCWRRRADGPSRVIIPAWHDSTAEYKCSTNNGFIIAILPALERAHLKYHFASRVFVSPHMASLFCLHMFPQISVHVASHPCSNPAGFLKQKSHQVDAAGGLDREDAVVVNSWRKASAATCRWSWLVRRGPSLTDLDAERWEVTEISRDFQARSRVCLLQAVGCVLKGWQCSRHVLQDTQRYHLTLRKGY